MGFLYKFISVLPILCSFVGLFILVLSPQSSFVIAFIPCCRPQMNLSELFVLKNAFKFIYAAVMPMVAYKKFLFGSLHKVLYQQSQGKLKTEQLDTGIINKGQDQFDNNNNNL